MHSHCARDVLCLKKIKKKTTTTTWALRISVLSIKVTKWRVWIFVCMCFNTGGKPSLPQFSILLEEWLMCHTSVQFRFSLAALASHIETQGALWHCWTMGQVFPWVFLRDAQSLRSYPVTQSLFLMPNLFQHTNHVVRFRKRSEMFSEGGISDSLVKIKCMTLQPTCHLSRFVAGTLNFFTSHNRGRDRTSSHHSKCAVFYII